MTISRQAFVQCGDHASVNDFSTAASSMIFIQPRNIDNMGPRDYMRLDREIVDPLNYAALGVLGPRDISAFSFDKDLRGVSGSGVEALTAATMTEDGVLLKAIFGSQTNVTGTGTTAVAAGSTTTIVNVTSGTNYTSGMPVAFLVDSTLGTYEVRYPTVSGNVLTCERALSAIPVNGSNVLRLIRYQAAPDVPMRTPVYFDVEDESARVQWFGCIPSAASIKFDNGGKATLSSTWMPNDWSYTHTQANPTFAAPTAGSVIVGQTGSLWINAEKFYIVDAEIDAGLQTAPRNAIADQGRRGVAVVGQDPVMKCKVFANGTNSLTGGMAFGGATIDMADLQLGTAVDVSMQVDSRRGAICNGRMPSADVKAKRIVQNGLVMIELEFRACRISGSNNYPFSFSIG